MSSKKSPVYATGIPVEPEALGLGCEFRITLSVGREDEDELTAEQLREIKAALAKALVTRKPAKKRPQAAE